MNGNRIRHPKRHNAVFPNILSIAILGFLHRETQKCFTAMRTQQFKPVITPSRILCCVNGDSNGKHHLVSGIGFNLHKTTLEVVIEQRVKPIRFVE